MTNDPVVFGYYLDEEKDKTIIKFITVKNTASGLRNTFLWCGIFK